MPVSMKIVSGGIPAKPSTPPKPSALRKRRHLFKEADTMALPPPPPSRTPSNEIYHLASHAQSKSSNAVFALRESLEKSSPDSHRFIALPVLFRHFITTAPPTSAPSPENMERVAFMTECLGCLAICLSNDAATPGGRRPHRGRLVARFQANWKNGVRRWINYLFAHYVESRSSSSSSSSSSDDDDDEDEEDFGDLVRNLLIFFGETIAASGVSDVLKTLPGFMDPYARWWMRSDVGMEDCLRIGKMRTDLGISFAKLNAIVSENSDSSDDSD